jgi:hypothetical protein
MDDLAELWEKISAQIAASEMVVFPVTVDDADLEWPDDDWAAFLDVAAAAGTRLLYAATFAVTLEDLDELVARADFDRDEPELIQAVAAARGAGGQPCRIELGFAYQGLTHRWMTELEWLAPLDEAGLGTRELDAGLDDEADWADVAPLTGHDAETGSPLLRDASYVRAADWEAARLAELGRLQPQVAELASQLAAHPDYVASRSQEMRRSVAFRVMPDLDTWVNSRADGPEGQARQRIGWDVLQQAEHALIALKDRRIAGAKGRLDEWAGELGSIPEFRDARRMEERRRCAGEFVTMKLGFASADVRDRLVAQALRR